MQYYATNFIPTVFLSAPLQMLNHIHRLCTFSASSIPSVLIRETRLPLFLTCGWSRLNENRSQRWIRWSSAMRLSCSAPVGYDADDASSRQPEARGINLSPNWRWTNGVYVPRPPARRLLVYGRNMTSLGSQPLKLMSYGWLRRQAFVSLNVVCS